ncbi:MAG: S8 family peptidase [Bdellovibrionota bacterium]
MKPIARRSVATLAVMSSFSLWAGNASSLLPKARGGFVPQRVIVKYKNAAIQKEFLQELQSPSTSAFTGVEEMGSVQRLKALSGKTDLFRFANGTKVHDVVAQLQSDPRIEWAQPDYYLSIFSSPEGFANRSATLDAMSVGFQSLVGARSALFAQAAANEPITPNTNPVFDRPTTSPVEGQHDALESDLWGMTRVGATQTWGQQRGSREIIVADIDTGVDYNHEDLRHNMWSGLGYDFADKDAFPWDTHGHGTHTSGTIGATGGNGIGVSGVVQKASIMAVRFIGSEGYGTTSDAVLSIDYAVQNGARVLSNSWGGAPEDDDAENVALLESIQRANTANVLFVAAAGNDGTDNDVKPMYPASMNVPNIITVASTTLADKRSFFSNFGKTTVHVGAPGSNIMSAWPGNKYMKESGTSMACPHVAGLATLILSERPDLSALNVKQIIIDSVSPFAALQGITVSGGIINTSAALERARTFGH